MAETMFFSGTWIIYSVKVTKVTNSTTLWINLVLLNHSCVFWCLPLFCRKISFLPTSVFDATIVLSGQYATVYQGGKINNVAVAIKCFTAAHRRMWQQENDIYRMPGLRQNRNIATFFGAKQNGSGNDLTLWLVLEYYPNGSIYDYLKGMY